MLKRYLLGFVLAAAAFGTVSAQDARSVIAGASKAKFLKALLAEGVPASGGYNPLNKEPFLKHTFDSRAYRAIYPARQLAEWQERNHCPANDKLCEEAVWFTQTMMLGPREDMDQIAEAVRKIQRQAGALIERS
jgi:dTDP-4-amino-4,6-dideoxygalactose transaminase